MRKLFTINAVCALLSSAAWAAGPEPTTVEPVVVAPAATAPVEFAGFYGGLSVGSASADGTLTFDTTGGPTTGPFDPESETTYGAFAGYNFQNGSFAYGVDAQYLSLGNLEEVINAEISDTWDLRARAGVQNGNFLFYAALGWSWASVTQTTTGNGNTLDGMNYGLGLEYQTGSAFFLGADYTMRSLDGSVSDFEQLDADVDTLTVRAGYRF